MPAGRRLKYFPPRRALLSPNLPMSEAVAILWGKLTPEDRRRLRVPFNHLMEYFGNQRLRSIRKKDYEAYAVRRHDEGAAFTTIERELFAMRQLWSACFDAELAWIAKVTA